MASYQEIRMDDIARSIKRETIHFRATDETRARLIEAARSSGLTPSDYARRSVEASLRAGGNRVRG